MGTRLPTGLFQAWYPSSGWVAVDHRHSARLLATADMNPRSRITTGLVPVWRISVDPSDTEADRGFSADADSVLVPTRPPFGYCCQ